MNSIGHSRRLVYQLIASHFCARSGFGLVFGLARQLRSLMTGLLGIGSQPVGIGFILCSDYSWISPQSPITAP